MKKMILGVLMTLMLMSTGGCHLAIRGWGHDHYQGGYDHYRDDRYDRGGYHEGGTEEDEGMGKINIRVSPGSGFAPC